jgi:hypothetical protein
MKREKSIRSPRDLLFPPLLRLKDGRELLLNLFVPPLKRGAGREELEAPREKLRLFIIIYFFLCHGYHHKTHKVIVDFHKRQSRYLIDENDI